MSIKVLVVDDLPVNLKLLRLALQAEGMEIVEAENGVEALKLLGREPVDCVVTDILMPEMDGYRLCREIRASGTFGALPIVVYTATYLTSKDEKKALDAGADLFMRKPVVIPEMCAAIRRLTARRDVRGKGEGTSEVVLRQYNADLVKELEARNVQLQEEQEKFRQITETIQEVFWMTSADGATLLYISPVYEVIWGRSCESLYREPMGWLDSVHPDDLARVKAIDRSAAYESEYRIMRPDGETRWVRVRSFPVKNAEGVVYRVAGTMLDITAEKSLRATNLQSQKMEAIGRLAGGVAHDFNNLLTVIVGLADINMHVLPAGNEQRADFEEIKNTGERAAQLTQQLLAFSRRQVFAPKSADLNELVTGTERLLRRLIGEDVRLEPRLAPGLRRVMIDPGQIGQVLVNLCVNARDSMPKGGTISIATAAVFLKKDLVYERFSIPAGEYSTLTVSDEGEGMSDEVKAHLFEPFFTTKVLGKGTGLGLATCFGIVKQSGGYIHVVSEPGKGSAFKIFLPASLEPAPPPASAEEPRAISRRGHETVLVVEDEAAVRGLIGRVLRAEGYAVLEGAGGEEGLRIAEADANKEINLVLTDVIMPVMNGRLLSERLKRSRPDIKVLFTSGYSDESLSRRGIVGSGEGFIRKPFTPESLARTVRETLDAVR